jgi:adenosylcobinamide-GDP ribazoletransferase
VILRPALIAVQFLTRVPVRLQRPPEERELGLSLLWYPVVGLLLGVLLWASALVTHRLAPPLSAALVLAIWVASTGALHLDGLADAADGWVGGHGNRERTLAIMKDPNAGPVAVAAVVGLLLLKFGALSALFGSLGTTFATDQHLAFGCVVPPLLARAAVPALMAHTAYVRAAGLGAQLARHQSRVGGRAVAAVSVLAVVLTGGRRGLVAVGLAAAITLLMRGAFVKRLGGVTGDCIGAIVEVVETSTLVAIVAS